MHIFYLHCNSSLDLTYFRFYKNKLHINTNQCKNPIVPEEGWFGQPKYSTSSKNHPTLCRFLLLYFLFRKSVTIYPRSAPVPLIMGFREGRKIGKSHSHWLARFNWKSSGTFVAAALLQLLRMTVSRRRLRVHCAGIERNLGLKLN